MTWSYSGNPADSDRDAVRFHIGDTDTTDQQLTNEEIAYILSNVAADVFGAAAECAMAIAAKYARRIDRSAAGISSPLTQKFEHYKQLAMELAKRANREVTMSVGGIVLADKDTLDLDTAAVQPSFRMGQDDLLSTDPARERV